MREPILLSDHFTIGKLLRFTVPSMVMMVFISIYSVIDGFFVSNFAGTTSFAALNLVSPFVMFLSVTGFVFGAGGTALSQLSGATIPVSGSTPPPTKKSMPSTTTATRSRASST